MSLAPDVPKLNGLPLAAAVAILGVGNLMVILDTTIANVSIPHIAGSLGVSPAQATWVITSYGVAEAIAVPLAGWLVQRFGALRVYITAMAAFGLCSIACGLAPSFEFLVFFRVLQGFCGGPVIPVSQSLMVSVSPPERQQQALGYWSMASSIGPILGPLLGGALSDTLGWRWIFFINIPVAVVVVFGAMVVLRGHGTATRKAPIDVVGLGLLILWVSALQLMLDLGREQEWFASPLIVTLAVTAAVGFLVFLIWELTAENPIVNLRVFRHRGFVAYIVTLCLTFPAYFSTAILVPLWMQTTLGYSATTAGRAAGFSAVLSVLLTPWVSKLLERHDPRKIMTLGLVLFATNALVRTQFTTQTDFWDIALSYLAQGVCMSLFFVPATTILVGSVAPQEVPAAAGLNAFMRTTGGAFGTAMMTTAWIQSTDVVRSALVGRMPETGSAEATLAGLGFSPDQSLAVLEGLVQTQAQMMATTKLFYVTAAAYGLAICCIWFAPRPPPKKR